MPADTVADYNDEGPSEMVEVKHPTPEARSGDKTTMLVRKDRAGQYEPVDRPDPTKGAKELAEEEGVDLPSVSGSGKDGRVTKGDVQDALDE